MRTRLNTSLILVLLLTLILAGCSYFPTLHSHAPPPLPSGEIDGNADSIVPSLSDPRKTIVRLTIENVGKPYKWGGASPETGFDCSGLVFYTHARAGIDNLPRVARNQYKYGRIVAESDIQPGDLLFFRDSSKKGSIHVGIYIGNQRFVHAPGRNRQVRVVLLSNPYFKKTFIGARSYINL